jgi:hypothetical protein
MPRIGRSIGTCFALSYESHLDCARRNGEDASNREQDTTHTLKFAANVQFPNSGTWVLQVVSNSKTGVVEVGPPFAVPVCDSLADWARSQWEILLIIGDAFHSASFILLFIGAYGVVYSTNAVTWGRKLAGGFNWTDAAWSSACKK